MSCSWGELIQPQHQQHPEGHAGHHHGSGEKAVAGDPRPPQAWQQQGEGTGGQHHAGRKAQHGVFHPLGTARRNRAGSAPSAVAAKPGGTAEEAIAHARRDLAGRQQGEALQQEQQDGSQGEQQPQGDEGRSAICSRS